LFLVRTENGVLVAVPNFCEKVFAFDLVVVELGYPVITVLFIFFVKKSVSYFSSVPSSGSVAFYLSAIHREFKVSDVRKHPWKYSNGTCTYVVIGPEDESGIYAKVDFLGAGICIGRCIDNGQKCSY